MFLLHFLFDLLIYQKALIGLSLLNFPFIKINNFLFYRILIIIKIKNYFFKIFPMNYLFSINL